MYFRKTYSLLTMAFALISWTPVLAQVIVDNDDGTPAYAETGSWSTSGSAGYDGSSYRFTSPGGSETATWTANLATTDTYEVFVWYVPGTNRTTSTRYDIHAADQTYTVFVEQTAGGFTWESLGTYTFNAGNNTITLDAGASTGGTAVIADAVRFGGSAGGACTLDSTEVVAVGVNHMVYTCPAPQVLHVIEYDLANPNYTVEVGFPQGKRNYAAKVGTTQIAAQYDALGHDVIAAVNASHFDAGIFIHGMHGSNSNVIGLPTQTWPKEAYVLEESGQAFVATTTPLADAKLHFADGAELPIDVFDYTCSLNDIAVYTNDWGASTGSTAQGVEVIVENVTYPWRANKWVGGTITAIHTGAASLNNAIPPGGFVLKACSGAEAELLSHVSIGDHIEAQVGLFPPEMNNAKVICGGASGWLVKDGAPFPENWNYGHAPARHPRTALAWNGTTQWFVTCDGRQTGYSVGMTYTELADFLVNSLGADHAVNIDGGGSTTMVIDGEIANCPSDGADPPCTGNERAVPNAVLLIARDATSTFPLIDNFTSSGRELPWDMKFTYNPVVPFAPVPPDGDGFVFELMNSNGGFETASMGDSGDRNYTASASLYCDYRPEVAADGFERVGIFARDDGNGNFDSTSLGGGNCYALTYDSNDGRIRAGVVVDGVFTDFLESDPQFALSTNWQRFEIDCRESIITFSVNDQILASVSDTTHAHGRFGIGYHEYFGDNLSIGGAHAEDFRAISLDFDWDDDGDVDLADFNVFALCALGPATTYPQGHLCLPMDGNGDLKIDLADFYLMQEVFTGN